MNKVLLIGKIDRATENLYACLSERFMVQICTENKETLRSIARIVKPDLIVMGSLELGGV